jgi:hypothetical protein
MAAKLSVVGEAVMVTGVTTLSVTAYVIGLPVAPAAVIVTVPVYVPTARLPAFTET